MIAALADFAIPLGALIVAAGALVTTAITIRSKATTDSVDVMLRRQDSADKRSEDHERRLGVCETERDRLVAENVSLMKKLLLGEENK
jgi:hypothetical protein